MDTNETAGSLAPSLGWIGLGRMGAGLSARLLANGCRLTVWNRTQAKSVPLVARGAGEARTPAELASCDIVFTMVSTSSDLREVLFADGGLLTNPAAKPRVVVDCSSIDEAGSAAIRELAEAAGTGFVCAPISGNSKAVAAGMVTVVASGRPETYRLVEPYLAMLGRRSTYVGVGELARVVKIAHNTMLGVVMQSLCEIVLLAQKAGVPRHAFMDFLNHSAMGSRFTASKTDAIVNLDFTTTFTPRLLLKDMDLGLDAARHYGVPMPAAAAMRQQLQAVLNQGHEDIDFSVMLREHARSADVELLPQTGPEAPAP
ncbi:MAG TPA: NAD(P)-dependent oxidoreductase [Ramlibacter sp.]|nr:NAD(P)-dependent oxidoreductase [Ramlibacter sp.]